MASVTVFVRPATKTKEADLRKDKGGTTMVNAQDVDTKQYLTIYERKDLRGTIFTPDMIGKNVTFTGTFHPLFDNVKMQARSATIVS